MRLQSGNQTEAERRWAGWDAGVRPVSDGTGWKGRRGRAALVGEMGLANNGSTRRRRLDGPCDACHAKTGRVALQPGQANLEEIADET